MYCSKCGNKVQEDDLFCTACGTPVRRESESSDEQMVVQNTVPSEQYVVYDRKSQRQKEIGEVKKMLNYFSKVSELYNEYDEVCVKYAKIKKRRNLAAFSWGCALTIIGSIAPVQIIFLFLIYISSFPIDQTVIVLLILGFLFVLLFVLLPGILLIKFDKKTMRVAYKNALAYYEKRYSVLSDKLYKNYLGYKNCPIGPEYTNPANIQVILDTIISGRADSTKEAINILVEDAHRRNMEDLAALTAQYTQQAAAQAGRAATASTVGAVFSAANYFRGR